MKKIKLDSFLLCLILLMASIAVQAQNTSTNPEKEEAKVIIIKKIVTETGEVHTEEIIREGSNINLDLEESHGVNIEIIGDLEDFEAGNIEVDVEEIETINIIKKDDKKKVYIRMKKSGMTDPKIIEWKGDGEIPEDIKKELRAASMEFEHIDVAKADRACMGVTIGKNISNHNGVETTEGESEKGVDVLSIIVGSGAEEAGLQKEDILTTINGTAVRTIEEVISAVESEEVGGSVMVEYLRNDQPEQVTVTLKQCQNTLVSNDIDQIFIIKTDRDEEEIKIEGENENFDWTPQNEVAVNTLAIETIDLFPNPTDSKISLQFEAPKGATTIRVVDLSGKEIYKEDLPNFDGNYQRVLDLTGAARGTLILTIAQGNKLFTEKIILQ